MKIALEVTGLSEALRQTRETAVVLPSTIEQGVYEAGWPVYYAVQDYAPERPGSSYVRTFDYQTSISTKVEVGSDSVSFEVDQPPEGYWLRGDADGGYRGAWMHVDRWIPLIQIIQTYTPIFVNKMQEAVDSVISRIWGS